MNRSGLLDQVSDQSYQVKVSPAVEVMLFTIFKLTNGQRKRFFIVSNKRRSALPLLYADVIHRAFICRWRGYQDYIFTPYQHISVTKPRFPQSWCFALQYAFQSSCASDHWALAFYCLLYTSDSADE